MKAYTVTKLISMKTNLQLGKSSLAILFQLVISTWTSEWIYKQVWFENDLNVNVHSFESDLNIGSIKLTAGYSHLDFDRNQTAESEIISGVLLGFGMYFNMPLHPTTVVKVSVYKDKIEYQASIQGGYKRFLCFVKFYKLNSFNELSVGIGTGLGYRLKKHIR